MLNKYDLVYVAWEDHSAEGGWSSEEDEIIDTTLCGSVGWLFRETDDALILISSVCEATKQVGNKQIIAKKLVHEKRTIRKARSRKQTNRSGGSVSKASDTRSSSGIVRRFEGGTSSDNPPADTAKEHC